MADKLYVVTNKADDSMAIVEAPGKVSALNYVIGATYESRLATPEDVRDYMTAGGVIENVNGKPEEEQEEDGEEGGEE